MLGQMEKLTLNITPRVPIPDPLLNICCYKAVAVRVTHLPLHFSQLLQAHPPLLNPILYYLGLSLSVKTMCINCRSIFDESSSHFIPLTQTVSYPKIQQAQGLPLGFVQCDNMAFWQNTLAPGSVLNNALSTVIKPQLWKGFREFVLSQTFEALVATLAEKEILTILTLNVRASTSSHPFLRNSEGQHFFGLRGRL